ncbi:MAG: host-nuclease inhibitor Gam family protein [Melioribacteraceae bacterium]|nr:host-nuclease inhibitor Gam family protein [Melioribacteraceae bacterium]MCF8265834.1 host-nuclease inhibitor Gam family protein [Melioribacteraceae bacterium]MCF8414530.1 host-nuclease inhibitor Gam family protein [Melioribacteraceae bacterium]
MIKRSKQNEYSTFEEVDQALKTIAENDSTIEKQTAMMNKKIIAAKETHEPKITELQQSNKVLENQIHKFLKKKKSLFQSVRSKTLTYGVVGFRKSPKHLSKTPKVTWDTIADKFFDLFGSKYVVLKKKLDKDSVINALKKSELTIEEIERTGAKVVQIDREYYELTTSEANATGEAK